MPAAVPQMAAHLQDAVARIAALMHGFSLEATRPAVDDIEELKRWLPAGTPVYLSSVPTHPHRELLVPVRLLRETGFEPVPHFAARRFASGEELSNLAARMVDEAGLKRALIIGGDCDHAMGPFTSALELIESGILQRHGIEEIGVAGYPDGHPRIGTDVLDRALAAKVEAAEQTGLRVHIVTQFAFESQTILSWIVRLRRTGIEQPIHIGMAGPTNIAKLIGYARRCGVGASARTLMRQAGLFKHLIGISAPDTIIRTLADAAHEHQLGDVSVHLFSFGGIAATARWAAAVAARHIGLDHDGFRAEPPAQ